MVARNFSQYPSYGVAPPAALLGAERGRSLGRTVMAIAIGALAFDLALIRPCNENGVPAVNLAAATMVAAGGGWSSQAHAAAPAVGVWDPGESLLAPEPMGVVQQFVTGSISTASPPDSPSPPDTASASPSDAPSMPEPVMPSVSVLASPPSSAPAERAAAPRVVPAPPAVTRPRAAAVRREAALATGRPAHRVAPRKPLDLAAVAAAPGRTRTVALPPAAEASSALGFRAPPPSCVPPFVFALGADAWELCGGSRASGAAAR